VARNLITAGFNMPIRNAIDGALNLCTGDLGCSVFNLDIGSEGVTHLIQSMTSF
jgi:hypothetical protein